uniref:Cystatin domain-containing protein n=1 Tax=Chlorocebus sabaeus TaxID=60711 RepID=A0A0D9RF38_CHLSB
VTGVVYLGGLWLPLLSHAGCQLLCFKSWDTCAEHILIAEHFPATVEFVSHTFHLQSTDSCAYKLVRVLSSWRKKIESKTIFSVELLLGKTRCGKFEDDIDNCPFQEIPELNHTLTCFFTFRTQPWVTQCELLKKTCTEVPL